MKCEYCCKDVPLSNLYLMMPKGDYKFCGVGCLQSWLITQYGALWVSENREKTDIRKKIEERIEELERTKTGAESHKTDGVFETLLISTQEPWICLCARIDELKKLLDKSK